jgi:SAM-dependent methyltransferase
LEASVTQRPNALPTAFLDELAALEDVYLRRSDPIEQSGFRGGPARWRAEREAILDAITTDGDLLDVGCANGRLLESLVWCGEERGLTLMPYGLDQCPRLIELARQRFPGCPNHFFPGNAWDWQPARRFPYVYMLLDVVPDEYAGTLLTRIVREFLAPRGRLIVGDYGSHSRRVPARDVAAVLRANGLPVMGEATAQSVQQTRFAWTDRMTIPGDRNRRPDRTNDADGRMPD